MVKKMRKRNTITGGGGGGFTLIEMLIVIAVIAILAGVVLTGVSGFQASARDTRRIGDMRNVQTYLELYFNKCGHYPVNGTGACGNVPTSQGTLEWGQLVSALETVTSQVPSDPLDGGSYRYAYGPNAVSYALQATLERDNSVLRTNMDSTFGLTCNEEAKEYCVKS